MRTLLEARGYKVERSFFGRIFIFDPHEQTRRKLDKVDAAILTVFLVELRSRDISTSNQHDAMFFLFVWLTTKNNLMREYLRSASPVALVDHALQNAEQARAHWST